MVKECVRALEPDHSAGRDVLVDFALHGLPPLLPEPTLVRWDREDGAQLDPTVVFLDDLELGSRLIEMESLAKINGQGNRPARLDSHEMRLHVIAV